MDRAVRELLGSALRRLGAPCDERLLDRFQTYMDLLLSWNEKINITAIREREDFVVKHFVDSAACYGRPELMRARRVVDIGTGGGFPGLPLALLMPDVEFTLVDALAKRLHALDSVLEVLAPGNVVTLRGRAEDLGRRRDLRESFDVCLSRALAGMSVLAEYCLPFVTVGGYMIAFKADDVSGELEEAAGAVKLLGGGPAYAAPAFPEGSALRHRLVFVEKLQSTPEAYPRRAGVPGRSPL